MKPAEGGHCLSTTSFLQMEISKQIPELVYLRPRRPSLPVWSSSASLMQTHSPHSKFKDLAEMQIVLGRLFFEGDIEIHPKVSVAEARLALANGLELGSGDGIIYLGICCPGKVIERPQNLAPGITTRRTHGTCTHAYGVTKWRAEGMLSHIDKVRRPISPENKYPRKEYMFYDFVTRACGETVTKAWILGINLESPVSDMNHWGLFYQDRLKYPSSINPKIEASGPH